MTLPLILFDDLQIQGDGNANFVIESDSSDYYCTRGIIKLDSATVIVAGTNSYAGNTTLARGAKLVADAITSSPKVTFHAGAVLGSQGGVSHDASGADTIAWTFSRHLDHWWNLVFIGSVEIEITGAVNDRLYVEGNLDISGATLNVVTMDGGFTRSDYLIATYTKHNGSFAAASGIPAGYKIDYAYDNNNNSKNIALVKTCGHDLSSVRNTGLCVEISTSQYRFLNTMTF